MSCFNQFLPYNSQFVNFFLQKGLHSKSNFCYVNLIFIDQFFEVEELKSLSHSKSYICYKGTF